MGFVIIVNNYNIWCYKAQNTRKKHHIWCFLFGGELGIRTPDSSHYNGFQDRRIRPLCQLSKFDSLGKTLLLYMISFYFASVFFIFFIIYLNISFLNAYLIIYLFEFCIDFYGEIN